MITPAARSDALSRLPGRLSAGLAMAGVVLALGSIVLGAPPAWLSAAILIGYAGLNLVKLGRVARIILAVSCLLAILGLQSEQVVLDDPLRQASFFFALLVVLQALGIVAGRSRDVVLAARSIITRAPGMRYLLLCGGSHLFALFLNLGSVALFMSMLAPQFPSEPARGVRSMSLAVVRGFASTLFWSPLAFALLIVVSLVEGASYWTLAPLGLVMAIVYIALGFLFDARSADPPEPAPAGPVEPFHVEPFHFGALLRTMARILAVVAGGLVLSGLGGLPLMEAVLLAELGVMLVWLAAQKIAAPGAPSAARTILSSSALMANELVIVACAMFTGGLCTQLIAAAGDFDLALSPLVHAGILAAIPGLVFLGGLVAVNPLVTVSILAGLLGAAWPLEGQTWLGLALLWGWGATVAGTPYNANILMAARAAGTTPIQLALVWNRRHSLTWLALGSLLCPLANFVATGF